MFGIHSKNNTKSLRIMTKWSAWKRWPATLLTEWYNNLTLSVRLIIVCIRNQTNKQTNEHNRICLHFYMRQTLSISIHKVIRHFSEHHTMHCRFVWLPFSEKRRRRRRRSRRHACTRFTCTRIVYITHAMCRRHSECTWIMNEWKTYSVCCRYVIPTLLTVIIAYAYH